MSRSAKGREQLVIHASGERWAWCLLSRDGRVGRSGVCDPASPDWPSDQPVRVLVDAADCIGLRLELPTMSAARQAQALRWAAEEHLASSAEDEHVVAGPRDDQGRLCCVVISAERMRALGSLLAGLEVEQIVPDALCLPWQDGQISLAGDRNRVLARWGDWDFGVFEADLAADLLDSLDADASRIWLAGEPPPEIVSGLSPPVAGRAAADLLDYLGRQLADSPINVPINLLSGPYSSGSARAARSWWRQAALAAAVVAGLGLALLGLEVQLLKNHSSELAVELDNRFSQAFPGVAAAGRHREQAERQLARLRFGESAGLLDLMNRAAPVMAGQSDLYMESFTFRDGRLEFALRGQDVPSLEDLARRLRALDLDATLESVRMSAEGASGRLRLSQTGSGA